MAELISEDCCELIDHILAEYIPIIDTCNFFIQSKDAGVLNPSIITEKENLSLEVSKGDKNKTINISCKGLYFKPRSLTNVQTNSEWLSFRLQTEDRARLISSVIETMISQMGSLELGNVKDYMEYLLNLLILCQCKDCKSDITSMIFLKKISSLPSVDWDSISEDWFCHLHENHKEAMKRSKFVPTIEQCFYSELFYTLNKSVLLESLQESNSILSCTKCGSNIGSIKDQVVNLWSDCVQWVDKDGKALISRDPKQILLSLFNNLEKDSFGVNARLVLQSNSGDTKYLFLVTMDTNLTILMKNNTDNLQSYLGNSAHSLIKKQRLSSDPSMIKLRKYKAIKLLYKIKLGEDDESGAWVDDINVHILPCSDNLFDFVLSMLASTTKYLPDDVNVVGDMKVGYIVR